MTSFEGRLADLEAHRQRHAAIKQHAVQIYEAVWKEIVEHVNEARSKGWIVETNGEPRRRAVLHQKQDELGAGKWVELLKTRILSNW